MLKTMLRNGLIVLFVFMLAGCSMEKKLSRKYEGEGRELLIREFGEPDKVVDMKNGIQRFIYIEESYIRETEIGTGSFTLDPRISPGFTKEETYRFDINGQGMIVKTSYEKRQK